MPPEPSGCPLHLPGFSSINWKTDPSNKRCFIRCEIKIPACNIIWKTPMAKWYSWNSFVTHFLGHQLSHRSGDKPWRNAIDSYVIASKFYCPYLGHANDGSFRGNIIGLPKVSPN